MKVMVITMTATEIITMRSNFSEYLLNVMPEIISGIISGLLATAIFWYFINKLLKPKIEVSRNIALSYEDGNDGDKIPVYRIKILNKSLRDAYNIKTTVRILYKGRYAIIELPTLPVLHGKSKKREYSEYLRELSFRLSHIRETKIYGFNDDILKSKYEKKILAFEDFITPKTKIEIILMALDSNNSLIIANQYYDDKSIIEAIIEGNFEKKTLTIEPKDDIELGEDLL